MAQGFLDLGAWGLGFRGLGTKVAQGFLDLGAWGLCFSTVAIFRTQD